MIFPTVTVKLLAPAGTTTDELGDRVKQPYTVAATVPGVLFDPGRSPRGTDLAGSNRPDGDNTTVVFHFPKTFDWPDGLRGMLIEHDGKKWAVVGDPQRFDPGWTPTSWCWPVEAKLVEG